MVGFEKDMTHIEVGQLTVVGELLWLAGDCEVPGLHSPPA